MKWFFAFIALLLPLTIFINFDRKIKGDDFVHTEEIIDIIETFPVTDNTLNAFIDLRNSLTEIADVFNYLIDSLYGEIAFDLAEFGNAFANSFGAIFELLWSIIKFVLGLLTDIVNIVFWGFSLILKV